MMRAGFDWAQRPDGIAHLDVAGVAVDSADRVYLFTRTSDQVLVYGPDGSFLHSWGDGVFTRAHALRIGPDDSVYAVDTGDHTVRKFTTEGDLLMTVGHPHQPSDTGWAPDQPVDIHYVEGVTHPGEPFHGCTDIAIAESGDFYVSDGYKNCRIHHFAPDGELLHSWGDVGSGPGQFRIPHAIDLAPDGRVFVADRENDRIQIFSPDGEYLDEWTDMYRPCAMSFDREGRLYVGELQRPVGNRSFVRDTRDENLPSRMTVFAPDGSVLTRWTENLVAPHALAIDSRGDLYIAEVTYTFGISRGLAGPEHADHQIQKISQSLIGID